jgi:hypothetical protein
MQKIKFKIAVVNIELEKIKRRVESVESRFEAFEAAAAAVVLKSCYDGILDHILQRKRR